MKDFPRHISDIKGRVHLHFNITCHSALALLFLCIPAFVLLSLYGCTDSIPGNDIGREDGEQIVLHIKTGTGTGPGTNQTDRPVDIFVYNDDALQRIDSYQRLEPDEGNVLAVASRKGDKIIAAISNPQRQEYEWNSISSFEALCEMTADLAMEDACNPLRSGTVFVEAADNGYCSLTMTPVLSEIHIRSIRCDFSGKPYSSATLKNACAYLTNVNSLAPVFESDDFRPMSPVNSNGYPDESLRTFRNPGTVYAEFPSEIGNVPVDSGIRLYCYPNSCEAETVSTPFTRLVISGEIEGTKYYYPININKGEFSLVQGYSGIARNCRYVFDITIRQTGTADPTIPVSPEAVSVSTEITPWDVLPETDIEF